MFVVPRPNRVGVGLADGRWLVVDSETGTVRHRGLAHAQGLLSVAPLADGWVSSGMDGKIRRWRADGALVFEKPVDASWAQKVLPSPDGKWILAAGGKRVRLWRADGSWVRDTLNHRSTVVDLAWARPSADRFWAAAYGGVSLHSLEKADQAKQFEWKGSPLALAVSPDGLFVATAEQDSSVHFLAVASGQNLEMTGYESKPRALAWSPDGRALATGGGAAITVWDCSGEGPEGSAPARLEDHEGVVEHLAFSKDGQTLCSAGRDGRVVLWDTERGTLKSREELGAPVSAFQAEVDGLAWFAGTETGRLVKARWD